MALIIFSILGVVFAFFGLGVFILSLICLLPVNIYNAILSSIKLSQHAIPLLNKSMVPALFFGGNIVLALVSTALFYMITRKHKEAKDIRNGKTDIHRSTTPSNQISNHNVFSHHKHSLMNGYTYTYVTVDLIWALIGSYLLYTLVSNNNAENNNDTTNEEEKQILLVIEAIRSQVSTLWMNLMVLAISACTMGFASLFFILGRKNRHPETKYLLTPNV